LAPFTLSNAYTAFEKGGHLKDQKNEEKLEKLLKTFLKFFNKFYEPI